MTRSRRTWRSAENGQNGADSGSICAQLYRMYRKLPKKKKRHRQRKRLRMREKEWSGRMDLNHRPPGPEISVQNPQFVDSVLLRGRTTSSRLRILHPMLHPTVCLLSIIVGKADASRR